MELMQAMQRWRILRADGAAAEHGILSATELEPLKSKCTQGVGTQLSRRHNDVKERIQAVQKATQLPASKHGKADASEENIFDSIKKDGCGKGVENRSCKNVPLT